jgi:hypothetical protein
VKNWILAVALAVIAIAPAGYFAYNMNPRSGEGSSPTIATIQFEEQQRNFVLEPGAVFGVRSVKVVDGYKFGLYLDGDKWIEAHLPVATKEEAIPVVIELLNGTTPPPPTVTLLRKIEGYWIVDLTLTHNGQRVNLISVLRDKELLLH